MPENIGRASVTHFRRRRVTARIPLRRVRRRLSSWRLEPIRGADNASRWGGRFYRARSIGDGLYGRHCPSESPKRIAQANRASDVQIKRRAGSVEPALRPKLTGL